MPTAATDPPAPPLTTSHRRRSVGPVFLWIVLQLLTLVLAALKTPYSLHFPAPEERMALEEMLVMQIGAAAMLFPLLLEDPQTAAAVIIASWPFTILAGTLSAQMAPWKIAAPMVAVTAWLCGLCAWLQVIRTHRARLMGVAVATGLALGGPLLWYLRAEFHDTTPELLWPRDGKLGPIMAALSLCDGSPRIVAAWGFIGLFLVCGVAAVLLRIGISRHLTGQKGRFSPQ